MHLFYNSKMRKIHQLYLLIVTCTGKLFKTRGKGGKDRDKIILNLEVDQETKERMNSVMSSISSVAQQAGVSCEMKFNKPHLIVSKDYEKRWGSCPPDQHLLSR